MNTETIASTEEVRPAPQLIAKKTCYCCGQEVAQTECPNCWSGHTRVGRIEFFWSGWLAKAVDVAWCKTCDFVWIVGADGGRAPICRDCRQRHLAIKLGAMAPEAPANVAAAA